ncbi:UDP-N-acetylglucosamine--N-acetylmuramyl-(pentapeptide) pyrophosphoryl-undecaprenol N-acetylglucosamine transferase [Fuerstiella marisgermanici]|uniref:UDP-N-acetylglucosamine--N-acetylmuramyl-(pentapeptide) pyrophosphoryl-undecaprenol N-acetylglucosamine transferase n=1 Tax=Fuerstiella marisgermanici TaxID=1891926 RepID=A0A1P8WBI2_9PLAN|nr:UDP-N-acetylglucosamine--N-acetylmuramyl-(pentapeptide) pyrophosphoryl-undecaprenol N-acetylglucosamine transferase [Fuerstiella marisgermanici]APZ91383.1 UDP-N-acetylglucosamine--N-acetylmuramyl-(pentapeptide) pyrophosphoryl-undecaprenol N-acetylglucosamine transferase [Fuerstiella marisgermanici]
MAKPVHIAFCGGGSGGHLTPAMAIAQAVLKENTDAKFTFFTSDREIDRKMLAAWTESNSDAANRITIVALPLTSSGRGLRYLANVWKSFRQCRRHFKTDPPDVVLGMGGFASVPGVLAARSRGIRPLLFEANRVPGRANLWLRFVATCTLTGWPVEKPPRWGLAVECGIPLLQTNKVSTTTATGEDRPHGERPPTLLILGGSQGASALNDLLVKTFTDAELAVGCDDARRVSIIHQTGSADESRIAAAWKQAGITVDVRAFIADVPAALDTADFVISRAGAITLAEIAAAGRASILIPLPSAKDNHQAVNADYFQNAGAAIVIDQRAPDVTKRLAEAVKMLSQTPERRSEMATSATRQHTPDVAKRIAALLIGAAERPSQ